MLAVILAEDDAFSRAVAHRSRLQKYSVVRYRDPVKLADSLPELHPDILIVRREDFPLHWELLAAELLCLAGMRNVRMLVFSASEIDAANPFPSLRFIPEMQGNQDGGSLQRETTRLFSEILASPFQDPPGRLSGMHPEFPKKPTEDKPKHAAKSHFMAAAEKQARSGR